jgi:hypothetical protein
MRALAGAITRGRAAKSAKVPTWMPDHAGINHAAVLVTVDVTVTGAPLAAHLVRDAGHDSGADAVECAMQYRYQPGPRPPGPTHSRPHGRIQRSFQSTRFAEI